MSTVRRGVTTVAIAGALLLAAACKDGTTPDCSAPNAGCGPDLDAASAVDAPAEAAVDAGGGNDAAADAPADSPADAPDGD